MKRMTIEEHKSGSWVAYVAVASGPSGSAKPRMVESAPSRRAQGST